MAKLSPLAKNEKSLSKESKCWAPYELECMENVDICATKTSPKEEDEDFIMESFKKDVEKYNINVDQVMNKYRYEIAVSDEQQGEISRAEENNDARATSVVEKKELSLPEIKKTSLNKEKRVSSRGIRSKSPKSSNSSLKNTSKNKIYERKQNGNYRRIKQGTTTQKVGFSRQAFRKEITKTFKQRLKTWQNVVFESNANRFNKATFYKRPIPRKKNNWLYKIFLFLILLQMTTAQKDPASSSGSKQTDTGIRSLQISLPAPGTLVVTYTADAIQIRQDPSPANISEKPKVAWKARNEGEFQKMTDWVMDRLMLFGLFLMYSMTLYGRELCRVTVRHKEKLVFTVVVKKDTTIDCIFRKVQKCRKTHGCRSVEGYFRNGNCPFLNPKKLMNDILESHDSIDICLIFVEAT